MDGRRHLSAFSCALRFFQSEKYEQILPHECTDGLRSGGPSLFLNFLELLRFEADDDLMFAHGYDFSKDSKPF